jgi:fumarate reductase (CoM/CoB) subunit B
LQTGIVTVSRYDPELDLKPHWETYKFPFEQGMTVLDVVLYVYENVDGTLTFSYGCRTSHCGLCGVRINGSAGLMCRETATREMILEPMDNLPIVRDLMVDREEYERGNDALRLYLERVSTVTPEPERIEQADLSLFSKVSRCVECYCCDSECPTLRANRHEFKGPSAMVQLARHTFDPRDQMNRALMAYSGGLYNCTTCGRCDELCPHSIAPSETIQLLRSRLIASGLEPRVAADLVGLVGTYQKAVLPARGNNGFLQGNANSTHGEVGLFVGCNMDCNVLLMPSTVAAAKVLRRIVGELAIPGGQVCCGWPLEEVGELALLRDLVIRNVECFGASGSKQVVTLCSACGLSAKRLWPQVYREATGQDLPFKVLDFAEFMFGIGLPLQSLQDLSVKVTYHDPCLLRRGQGIHEEPRRLLQALPGLELVEMEHADYCCGGGGGVRAGNLRIAERILDHKMSFVNGVDVDAIVTSCPTCIKQLRVGLAREGRKGVKVLHPALLVAKAMGL